MHTVDHACVFARATGPRLLAAERLVGMLPYLLGGGTATCDLAYRTATGFLAVTVRIAAGDATPDRLDRLAFWCARSGGRAAPLAALSAAEVQRLRAAVEACDLLQPGIAPEGLFEAVGRFFTQAGAPRDRQRSPTIRPILAMDLGGPGWEGVRYRPEGKLLFVAAPISPPVGDILQLSVRIPARPRPLDARAVVVEVRSQAESGPGRLAGYMLRLESIPPALEQELLACPPPREPRDRSAPRFAAGAPVRVVAPLPGPPPADPPAGPASADPPAGSASAAAPAAASARVAYASDEELAADFIQNLSQGGAFVRTPHPLPVGSPLALELMLPNGAELTARATVAYADARGMGVRFSLDPAAEAILASAIAAISARPRRALLVDDDALARRMLGDALAARGFEVITSPDATDGLRTLAAELLALDLLVTDVCMPGMDGEELVRRIRQVGGEADLAIVVVSGRVEGDLGPRLEAAGADAVLDKSLGPELIAEAADAALERKRLAAP